MAYRVFAIFLVVLLAATGCRTAQVDNEQTESTAQGGSQRLADDNTIPSGTELRVELNQKLSTESTKVGDEFSATVLDPLISVDGETVVPAGATVRGKVTGLKRSKGTDDQAAIRLNVEAIEFDGETYELAANIVQTEVETERDKSDIGTGAAIGGVAGAALGAIIGRDVKGALIGGAIGAGAGTIISLGVGSVDAELPAGSEMTLRTTRSIDVED